MTAGGSGGRRNSRAAGGGGGSAGSSAARGGGATSAKPARGARWLLLLLVAFGCMHVVFMLGVEGLRLARAQITIDRLEREVAALQAEAAGLEAVIEHGGDEAYREQLARRQGYMYPDEIRIVTSEPR